MRSAIAEVCSARASGSALGLLSRSGRNAAEIAPQDRRVVDGVGQRVVDLVSHAGGERFEDGHLLPIAQARLSRASTR